MYSEPEESASISNPDAVKDLWLSCMKPAQEHGTLEKQPTVKGTSKMGRDKARTQNYWLTRKSYGMPENYDCIKWNHDLKGKTG